MLEIRKMNISLKRNHWNVYNSRIFRCLLALTAIFYAWDKPNLTDEWKKIYMRTLASMLLLLLLDVDRLFSFSQVTAGLHILAVSPLLHTGGLGALGGLTPRLLGLRTAGLFNTSSHFGSDFGKGRKLRFRGDEGRSASATAVKGK